MFKKELPVEMDAKTKAQVEAASKYLNGTFAVRGSRLNENGDCVPNEIPLTAFSLSQNLFAIELIEGVVDFAISLRDQLLQSAFNDLEEIAWHMEDYDDK